MKNIKIQNDYIHHFMKIQAIIEEFIKILQLFGIFKILFIYPLLVISLNNTQNCVDRYYNSLNTNAYKYFYWILLYSERNY